MAMPSPLSVGRFQALGMWQQAAYIPGALKDTSHDLAAVIESMIQPLQLHLLQCSLRYRGHFHNGNVVFFPRPADPLVDKFIAAIFTTFTIGATGHVHHAWTPHHGRAPFDEFDLCIGLATPDGADASVACIFRILETSAPRCGGAFDLRFCSDRIPSLWVWIKSFL